jgi:L,D-peptidoglycan transpeptidase YkuD (ErfK/YbiS/YcfS/YnhG family)
VVGAVWTTVATYEAWTRTSTGWRAAFGPWTAHLGYNGLAPSGAKREGDGRTPSGVYGFAYDFGVQADPGVHLSWRAVTGTYDVWDDDPSSPSYNEWVDTRTGSAGSQPEPMDNTPAYDEGAVIAYNTARTPGLGSAIFMHVSDGGSTAGCVSIPQADLTQVLRWMEPGAIISIGVA